MRKFPTWIKKKLIQSDTANKVDELINKLNLHTVCKSACCPNKSECFSQKKATFMILGNICTRDCKFCSIKKGKPLQLNADEPKRLSEAVKALSLTHVIITSVTRDDLLDGGAGQFYKTAYQIKKNCPDVILEVLTPDFGGNKESIDRILDSPIDIFSHNLQTVPRLYNIVRPKGDYKMSLNVLSWAKEKMLTIKSGLMVGLGEVKNEVYQVMHDLRDVGCEFLTIGQYLQPTKQQLDVCEYVHPKVFDLYKEKALSLGFKDVLSSPFARTSYMNLNIIKELFYGESNIT